MMIIDDTTPITVPPGQSTGYQGMYQDRARMSRMATHFPPALLVPRDQRQAWAEEMQANQTSLFHLLKRAGWRVKNQAQTNYCWIFSPVAAVEMLRITQNQPHVSLSPASCGGPITGYKNVGGWGQPGLEYIAEHGVVPSALWPDTAIDKRYHTPTNVAAAADFRATEWMALDTSNLDQIVSCLLRRIPVSGGFNWWRHQVTLIDALWNGRDFDLLFANSWDDTWGDNGYGILRGNRRLPADAVAPRVITAA